MMKSVRTKGKVSLTKFFQEFKTGDRIQIIVEPSYHGGLPYRRFLGKSGIIAGKRGECYEVTIIDGKKEKMQVLHPIHLKRG